MCVHYCTLSFAHAPSIRTCPYRHKNCSCMGSPYGLCECRNLRPSHCTERPYSNHRRIRKRFTHSHTIIHAYTPWHKIHTFPATHTERGAFLQLSPNWSLSLMLCRIRAAAWGFELQLSPAFIVSRGNSHAHPAAHTRSSQLFLYPVLSGASCHTGKP